MATPLCRPTVFGVGILFFISLFALVSWPMAAVSFQAGILVGLLLHSSHVKEARERDWLEEAETFK